MEIRTKERGTLMLDEEQSAHQFSIREQSVQADEEERLDLEMEVNAFEEVAEKPGSAGSRTKSKISKKSLTKSNVSLYQLSPVEAKSSRRNDSLLPREAPRAEIAIQTDPEPAPSKRSSHRPVLVQEPEHYQEQARQNDADAFKEDWSQALVFKKAMKLEAIRRGEPYASEYEVDDEEEAVEMTNTQHDLHHVADVSLVDQPAESEEELQMANTQEGDTPPGTTPHTIGFMKKLSW